MDSKNLIKAYEQLCVKVKKDNNEENKQRYLMLFNELDSKLDKTFDEKMEQLSYSARNILEEIKRVELILEIIKIRRQDRNRMVRDYTKIIGYAPKDLDNLLFLDSEADYVAYRTNLIVANEMIVDLIKIDRQLNALQKDLLKKRNKKDIKNKILKLEQEQSEKFEELKNNKNVVEDLYNYCLTAPYSVGNAYIEYVLIKLLPRTKLPVSLGPNKRNIAKKKKRKN